MALSAIVLACAVCAAPSPPVEVASGDGDAGDGPAADASLDFRAGGLELGRGATAVRADERRIEPRLGFAPVPAVRAWVGIPVLVRSITRDRAERTTVGLGDVELGVDAILADEREGLRGTLVLSPLVKLPTAPLSLDPGGEVLSSGLQAGCASIVPAVSIAHTFGERWWDVHASLGLLLPFVVRDAPHRGAQIAAGADVAVHPIGALNLRVGSRWLLEASGEGIDGETEPDSGGATHYLVAGIDVTHRGIVTGGVSVDVPAGAALRGEQAPSPVVGLRLAGRWAP